MKHDTSTKNQAVILLHGLARTKVSMRQVDKFLKKKGYAVINMGYPSCRLPIKNLSETVIPKALNLCNKQNIKVIHFVTHSLGGILVRFYLARHQIFNLGRVIMLSPPNHGSELVDKLKNLTLFKWLNGPSGQQLGTDFQSIPNRLGAVDYDVGVMTGDRSVNFFLSMLIPGVNDGKVSVDSARLEGMKDFMVVHKSHPFIMNDPYVHHQIYSFLQNGRFDHGLSQQKPISHVHQRTIRPAQNKGRLK